jgi:hypothetical protein
LKVNWVSFGSPFCLGGCGGGRWGERDYCACCILVNSTLIMLIWLGVRGSFAPSFVWDSWTCCQTTGMCVPGISFGYAVEFIPSFCWYAIIVQEISKVHAAISVANNACWAIGELAVKVCYCQMLYSNKIIEMYGNYNLIGNDGHWFS